jgi:signal transduction histidine kinase
VSPGFLSATRDALLNSRRIRATLVLGFGLILVLMAVAGIDSLRSLRKIQDTNFAITYQYLERVRALDKIRSSLYLSSMHIRDYLLDQDPVSAERHLDRLKRFRVDTDSAIAGYDRGLSAAERVPSLELQRELDSYWRALDPVLAWDARLRKEHGYEFLTKEVIPHRAKLLDIANAIAEVNEEMLHSRDQSAAELFDSFRFRLILELSICLGVGAIVAAVSVFYILRLENAAQHRYSEVQQLSARLVAVQEEERRTLSRELHDEVGQTLSAILVDLGNAAALTPPHLPELKERHSTLKRLAESAINSVRNIALLLRPSMLDDFGLVPALHWQAREVSRRTGMQVDLTAEDVPDSLTDEQRTCIYRLVQEALHNCARHSGATSVSITVERVADRLQVSVKDNGSGFDASHTRGLGLVGMEERTRQLGGAFEVVSLPQKGTVVKVSLPLAPEMQHA